MSDKKFPSEELPKFMVRIPAGLKERVKQSAKKHLRSMNSEFLFLIDKGLDQKEGANHE